MHARANRGQALLRRGRHTEWVELGVASAEQPRCAHDFCNEFSSGLRPRNSHAAERA
jgi:hypothetical protein